MLRELHDATGGFDRAGRVWALPAREPAEVICHNDFAPYNLASATACRSARSTSRPPRPARAPGTSRTSPTGSSRSPTPGTRTSRRSPIPRRGSRALCAAYGGIDPAAVLALVPQRLRELAATAPAAHAELYRADAAHVARVGVFGLRPKYPSRLRARG